jgi:hypothetical protein
MPDEHPFTLRQVDRRADFAAIEDPPRLHQGSARAGADAVGTGADRARDHVRRGGARDRADRAVLAALAVSSIIRNWWIGFGLRPRISIVPDPSGKDWVLVYRGFTEWSFKIAGWLAMLATLQFIYTRTGHISFFTVRCALEILLLATFGRFLFTRLKFDFTNRETLPDGWRKLLNALVTGTPVGLLYVFIHNWMTTLVNDISQIQLTGCH